MPGMMSPADPGVEGFSLPRWERVRRLIPTASCAVAALLWRMTPLEPVIKFKPRDIPAEWEDAKRRSASASANPDRLIVRDPEAEPRTLEGFVTREARGHLISVHGEAWERFFSQAGQAFDSGSLPPGWEHRITKEEARSLRRGPPREPGGPPPFSRLYFFATEAPWPDVSNSFSGEGSHLLRLESSPPRYGEVGYLPKLRTTGLGSGFYGVPPAFAYPYQRLAALVFLLGWVLYALIPWAKSRPDICEMRGWRLVGTDLAALLLLFLPFFILPLLIVGNSAQAAAEWLFFSLFFWLVAALSFVILAWNARQAAFRILIRKDGLLVATGKGFLDFPFQALGGVQDATLQAPRWLIRLLWLAAILGGRRGMGAAGQALILTGSLVKGLYLTAKDGRTLYVWYSDPMGNISMVHFDALRQSLDDAGIPKIEGAREIRAILPPWS